MILVFKTSVKDEKDIKNLQKDLNEFSEITKWNFDLEDIDNVLRIESMRDVTQELVDILADKGFDCEDLGQHDNQPYSY